MTNDNKDPQQAIAGNLRRLTPIMQDLHEKQILATIKQVDEYIQTCMNQVVIVLNEVGSKYKGEASLALIECVESVLSDTTASKIKNPEQQMAWDKLQEHLFECMGAALAALDDHPEIYKELTPSVAEDLKKLEEKMRRITSMALARSGNAIDSFDLS